MVTPFATMNSVGKSVDVGTMVLVEVIAGIDVKDFVRNNIQPYYGDASFLAAPTDRTKALWQICLEAMKEERQRNGCRVFGLVHKFITHPLYTVVHSCRFHFHPQRIFFRVVVITSPRT